MKKWKISVTNRPFLALVVLSLMGQAAGGCNDTDPSIHPDTGGSAQCGPNLRPYKTACIPIFDACKDNEVPMPGGGCKRVGVERCEGGIMGPPDWTCKPIGPPTKCLAGWEKVKGGWCEPIVPPKACTGLTMAKIGLRTCQPIMDCGTGKWGNIKTTAATIFVDQSYTGNDPDGSEAKPYTSIATALNNASTGGHIVVAAGIYHEDLNINRAVTIDGICPQNVNIKSVSSEKHATVDVYASGSTRIRGVTIAGKKRGVEVFGPAVSAVLERVAVVECESFGVHADEAQLTVKDSLISGNRFNGIQLMSAPS